MRKASWFGVNACNCGTPCEESGIPCNCDDTQYMYVEFVEDPLTDKGPSYQLSKWAGSDCVWTTVIDHVEGFTDKARISIFNGGPGVASPYVEVRLFDSGAGTPDPGDGGDAYTWLDHGAFCGDQSANDPCDCRHYQYNVTGDPVLNAESKLAVSSVSPSFGCCSCTETATVTVQTQQGNVILNRQYAGDGACMYHATIDPAADCSDGQTNNVAMYWYWESNGKAWFTFRLTGLWLGVPADVSLSMVLDPTVCGGVNKLVCVGADKADCLDDFLLSENCNDFAGVCDYYVNVGR